MRLNKLDLNQLVALDALLSTQSVNKAAEKLFLSQPAMSCSLKRLREFFKDDLLTPVGKTLVLTPLGREIAEPVRNVLVQINTIMCTRPTFDPGEARRRFRIEASDYVISVFLSEICREVSKVAPFMQFEFSELGPDSRKHLENGDIEMLIAPNFAVSSKHPITPVFEDTFTCLIYEKHSIKGNSMSERQYFEAVHVGVEWGGGRRVTFDSMMIAASTQERYQEVIVPNFSLIPDFLVNTMRVATVPTRLALKLAEQFPLRTIECPVDIPKFVENLQWNKYQEQDPAISWLRSTLVETGKKMSSLNNVLKSTK